MSGVGGGNYYYGKYGFLYKQKPPGGARKSTKFGAGGGDINYSLHTDRDTSKILKQNKTKTT